MFSVETNKLATLCHTGIYIFGSPLDTGNYVPDGQVAPDGVPVSRMYAGSQFSIYSDLFADICTFRTFSQRQINFKCEVSYGFDTAIDSSFYKCAEVSSQNSSLTLPLLVVQKIEVALCRNKSFNPDSREQRDYQVPSDSGTNGRFFISSPLFVKRTTLNRSKPSAVGRTLHPWIGEALKVNGRWMANPELPRILVYQNDSLTNLADDSEPRLKAGDVIWMSFTLTFSIGPMFWAPEYRPIELVRIGR